MQKRNRESLRKLKKYCAAVCIVLILGIPIKVYAYEIGLLQRDNEEAEKDIARFNIRVSKVWTSKGKGILSYDVSESGDILIVFPDSKIAVFDENMNFLSELSFHSDGAYGAAWHGTNFHG